MKIKTRLGILFISVTAVIFLTVVGLLYAEGEIDRALAAGRKAYGVVNHMAEFNCLATEINHSSKKRIQWLWKKKMGLLAKEMAGYQHGPEQIIALKIAEESARLDETFGALLKTIDTPLAEKEGADVNKDRNYRLHHLSLLLRSVSALAHDMVRISHDRIQVVQAQRNRFLMACGILWCGGILFWTVALACHTG